MEVDKNIKEVTAYSSEEVGYAMKEACKIVKEQIKELDENPEKFEKFVMDWLAYRATR